nr:hypothetical protein [Caldalkalibacillus mannanilyticus]
MGLKEFFSNRTETSENHQVKELRTRYYKTTKTQAMKVVKEMLEQEPRITLLDVSEDRGEINAEFIKPKRAYLVVNIITVFPYRTAIDFAIITKTSLPMDFGYSKKETLALYERLDKHLEFVGTSLSEKEQV